MCIMRRFSAESGTSGRRTPAHEFLIVPGGLAAWSARAPNAAASWRAAACRCSRRRRAGIHTPNLAAAPSRLAPPCPLPSGRHGQIERGQAIPARPVSHGGHSDPGRDWRRRADEAPRRGFCATRRSLCIGLGVAAMRSGRPAEAPPGHRHGSPALHHACI